MIACHVKKAGGGGWAPVSLTHLGATVGIAQLKLRLEGLPYDASYECGDAVGIWLSNSADWDRVFSARVAGTELLRGGVVELRLDRTGPIARERPA